MNSEKLTKEYLSATWNIDLSDIETSLPKKGDAQIQVIAGLREIGFYYTQIATLLKTNPSYVRRHYVIYKTETVKKIKENQRPPKKNKKYLEEQNERIKRYLKIEHYRG